MSCNTKDFLHYFGPELCLCAGQENDKPVHSFMVRHQELKDCDMVFKERPRPKWKSRAGKGRKVRVR